ncbi:HAD family hydrolase [Mycobacterium uberis]|uniref:HAD family hydrolase n=1 Tax=Mycobacterium uberis TaxID=2162698 RepID=UPI000E300852
MRQVTIAHVTVGTTPADKATAVKRLQSEDQVVAMVDDGVNDAAALATADLGLAIGSGVNV